MVMERNLHAGVKTVRVFTDEKGEWRWTGLAGNGEPLADSDEGYVNHSECRAEAQLLFPNAEFDDEAAPRFDARKYPQVDGERMIWDISDVADRAVSLSLRVDTLDEGVLAAIEKAAADHGIVMTRRENPIT